MSKQNNLTDFLKDVANTLKAKADIVNIINKNAALQEKINPQDFSKEILEDIITRYSSGYINGILNKIFKAYAEIESQPNGKYSFALKLDVAKTDDQLDAWNQFCQMCSDPGIYEISMLVRYWNSQAEAVPVGLSTINFTIISRQSNTDDYVNMPSEPSGTLFNQFMILMSADIDITYGTTNYYRYDYDFTNNVVVFYNNTDAYPFIADDKYLFYLTSVGERLNNIYIKDNDLNVMSFEYTKA